MISQRQKKKKSERQRNEMETPAKVMKTSFSETHTQHTHSSRGDGDPKSKRPYKRSRWRTGHQTDPAGVLRNVRLKIKSKTRLCHMGAWDTSIPAQSYTYIPTQLSRGGFLSLPTNWLIAACRHKQTSWLARPNWVLIYERDISLNSNINT